MLGDHKNQTVIAADPDRERTAIDLTKSAFSTSKRVTVSIIFN